MDVCWARRELREGCGGIANVGATGDVCVQEFAKKSSVGEAMLGFEVSVFV